MTNIAYYLMWENTAAYLALDAIQFTFPCFVQMIDGGEDYFEAHIRCRIEDVNAIKARLAPFM